MEPRKYYGERLPWTNDHLEFLLKKGGNDILMDIVDASGQMAGHLNLDLEILNNSLWTDKEPGCVRISSRFEQFPYVLLVTFGSFLDRNEIVHLEYVEGPEVERGPSWNVKWKDCGLKGWKPEFSIREGGK